MTGHPWPVPRTRTGIAAAAALFAGLASLTGCGGSGHATSVRNVNPSPARTVTTTSATSVPGPVPTVFDCGGGAYEPKTLLVVCGVATTNATNVTWTSWTSTGATGSGTVNLAESGHHGSAPATLELSKVVQTGNGPQFSVLDVTWTGPSPSGHPSDQFQLAVAPG